MPQDTKSSSHVFLINSGEEAYEKEMGSYQEVTLVINSTNRNLLKRKNDKEIIYEGSLYDIKSEETVGKKFNNSLCKRCRRTGIARSFRNFSFRKR